MSKHTPGPWHVETAINGVDQNIMAAPDDKGWTLMIATTDTPNSADARLIAAAPELLDLARNVAGLDSRYLAHNVAVAIDAIREWQEQARAAIAKAEGKS